MTEPIKPVNGKSYCWIETENKVDVQQCGVYMKEATNFMLCEREKVPLKTFRKGPFDIIDNHRKLYEITICINPSNFFLFNEIGFDKRRKVIEHNYNASDNFVQADKYLDDQLRQRIQQLGVQIVHFNVYRISVDPIRACFFTVYDPVTKFEYKMQDDLPYCKEAMDQLLDRVEKDRKG